MVPSGQQDEDASPPEASWRALAADSCRFLRSHNLCGFWTWDDHEGDFFAPGARTPAVDGLNLPENQIPCAGVLTDLQTEIAGLKFEE